MDELTKTKEKIAVFIDADNAPAGKIDFILAELAKYGVVNIRKAYGNWTSANLKSWTGILHEYAIQPMQQFDLTKGKNATDIALVIDVMDVLYTKQVDIICLVSSDCDFTPLVTRMLADGKAVIGFGERKTPEAFVNACSRFLFVDEKPAEQIQAETKVNLKGDAKLINLLRQAMEACENEDGWSHLGALGSHIANHASFDPRNYGYKKLSDLLKAINLFETKKVGNALLVRDKRKAKD
jgi:uncharacterized protein (TIGR00288 family)